MGLKLYSDQNEKLAMFGVTHVIAIDGYSSKIVAHACMPVKNNLTTYEEVYRKDHTKMAAVRLAPVPALLLCLAMSFIRKTLGLVKYDREELLNCRDKMFGLSGQSANVPEEIRNVNNTPGQSHWGNTPGPWRRRTGVLSGFRRQPYQPMLPALLLSNVQSLKNKMDELLLLIQANRDHGDCSAICLTETWLDQSVLDVAVNPPAFTVYRADRSAVVNHGIWDQIRMDPGKEFYLSLFIQEIHAHCRLNQNTPPYCQTTSTKNHKVERIWSEVNSRGNFPLKEALDQLTNQEVLDMDCNISGYCVSNLTGQLCHLGINRVVEAWSAHRISGDGCAKKVRQEVLPHAAEAADLYTEKLETFLTRASTFGTDPFSSEQEKATVTHLFAEKYPDIEDLFNNAVNKSLPPFKDALVHLVNLIKRHA